jgi:large subunit ribosomal protein L28
MKCAHCGKATTFGHNRSCSLPATNPSIKPNLPKVTLMEKGRKVQKVLCTKCIRTAAKSS